MDFPHLQAVLSSRPERESLLVSLRRRGEGLQLEENLAAEVQQLANDAEQQWRTLLQAAGQAELRALFDDFDSQSQNTQSWIREKQQQLQKVSAQTPAEGRRVAAQVSFSLTFSSHLLFIHREHYGGGQYKYSCKMPTTF